MSRLDPLTAALTGARCWGIELDPRFRVLAVTVEPDPLRAVGQPGEHQLLCFPVSTLIVSLTRPVVTDGVERTALVTFDLEQLTAVSERFGGAVMPAEPFGRPEPRPGSWGPRSSLEGRSSAPDGTRATLTLDLQAEDGARLRLFARFDEAELRDRSRTVVLSTQGPGGEGHAAGMPSTDGSSAAGPDDAGPPEPLRF